MLGEDRGAAALPPHVLLILAVAGVLGVVPFLIGDGVASVTNAISDLLKPAGLFLVTLMIVLLIRFLSSERASAISDLFSFGSPDSIHRVGGSPLGVAAVLAVILFLLYHRISLFSDDDSGN